MLQKVELLSTTTFRNLQQPDLLQDRIESGWKNVTRFAVMLQKKLNVFVVRFTVPLRIWACVGRITTVSTRREGGTWKSANFFARFCSLAPGMSRHAQQERCVMRQAARERGNRNPFLVPRARRFLVTWSVTNTPSGWGTRMRKSRINFPALWSPHNRC